MAVAREEPHWRRSTDDLRTRLQEFVKESSNRNRAYFIAWILFALYVFVTVGGTTDLQLLIPESGVPLPALGIQMPLFTFYLAIPLLVLAVHFNLMQNLDRHAFKLNQWRDAWDGTPPTAAVHAFLFDQAAFGGRGAFGPLVQIANDILCYWLGPLLLSAILIRFSDYQSPVYTTFHFAILLIDVGFVLLARRALPQFRPGVSRIRRAMNHLVFASAMVSAAALTVLPLALIWGLYFALPSADLLISRLFNWWDRPEFFTELLIPRLYIDANAQITALDSQIELRAKVDGKPLDAWWREQGNGINLVGRNLNYATLAGTNLRKGDFTNARMRRVDLSGAALQDSSFVEADLQGADLDRAKLQGANLVRANLTNAMLVSARLDGALLFGRSNLSGADLTEANLSGAYLWGANLSGANLNNAILYGADLRDSTLDGALLIKTRLHGSTLDNASLRGAILIETQLHGTTLDGALVDGTVFTNVVLPADTNWKGLPLALTLGERSEEPDWVP